MDLKNLMIDTKSVWVDFPGLEGFSVEVANLSKKALTKISKSCTITKFVHRQPVDSLDDEKFVKTFTKATVKNWKGLTIEHLQSLILINTEGEDLTTELEYSDENAKELVSNSVEFDSWLNEVVFDLDNFRTKREEVST